MEKDGWEYDMFVYEATISKNAEGYFAQFEDIGAAYAPGDTLEEVIKAAAETLQLVLAEYLDSGMKLPKPTFRFSSEDTMRVAVAVEVSQDFIDRTKCVTVTEAAQELGVTKGRISHMLDAGILQALPFGNERLVTLASINARKMAPRGAGRPRKDPVRV